MSRAEGRGERRSLWFNAYTSDIVVQLRTPSLREHKEMNAGLAGNLEIRSGRIPDNLEEAARLHVRRVFEKYGENLTRAAEALDVSRNTVRKYLGPFVAHGRRKL